MDGDSQSQGSGLSRFTGEGGGGGEIHHDQCVLADDMNHVAGEGERRMDKPSTPQSGQGQGRPGSGGLL